MKILYVGPLFAGSTALHRMTALRDLGHEVVALDTTLPFGRLSETRLLQRVAKSFFSRTNGSLDWRGIQRAILRARKMPGWDILWVDKGQSICADVLRQFKVSQPSCVLVNYSPDDMFNPGNQTDRYLAGISVYDLFVTTKSYNVDEFRDAGVRNVIFVGNAYEPSVHRPMKIGADERARYGSDVVFVGAVEPERLRSLDTLARTGLRLGLHGGGKEWLHLAKSYPNVCGSCGFIAGMEYARILCASKIGLGFLRKANRDLQTTRSIEIPACGVFMLAERTVEHLELFEEGKEAEFFASDDELVDKCRFYLRNEEKRKKIAELGRERCLKSGYSNAERLSIVLDCMKDLR